MKRKKKVLIIIFSVIGILLAAIGGIGAYFIIEGNKAPVELEDTEAKYTTTLKEAPTDGSLPTEHSATDVIAYALYNVAYANEFKVITTGSANASITTQQIANERVVKNGSAMISTVSSGMISLGTQRYFFPQSENKVLVRDAKKINNAVAVWDTEKAPECVTYKEMKKRYGWYPFQANGYIICDDTFLNKDDIIVVDNNDGTYSINFSLDPDGEKAPFWYRREIITSSGSTIVPIFSKIEITFKIDKNYYLLEQAIKEIYTVKSMGVEAETKTDVIDSFSYTNVEFNQEYYDWFMKYKILEPVKDSDEDDNGIVLKEDDVATMVVSSLQNNKNEDVNLDLNLKFNDINLDGSLSLNINDLEDISLILKLGNYINAEFKNNVLYLNINDNKFKASLDDLDLGDDLSLDVNDILSSLNSGEVIINDNNILINADIEIENISINLIFDIDKIDGRYDLNNISAKTNILGNEISIEAIKTDNKLESIIDDNYKELDINSLISNVKNIIENKEFNLYLNLDINNINIIIDGDVSFKDKLYINATINIKVEELEIPLSLVYYDDVVYIKYENIKLSLDKEIFNKFFNLITDKELNIDTLLSILPTDINLDDILSKINKLDIESNDEINLDLEYDDIALYLNIEEKNVVKEFDNSNYIDLTNFLTNLIDQLDKEDVKLIIEDVNKILDIAKEKEFNINLDLSLDQDDNKYLDIVGNIQFYVYENGRFDLEIIAKIYEYNDDLSVKMVHSIDLKLLSKEYFSKNGIEEYNEDYIFVTYGTNPNQPNNLIKMYSPAKDLLNIVGTFTQLLGVDLSFLNNYSTFNFNDIDVTQIKNLFSGNDLLKDINLDSLINDIEINSNDININLNLSGLLKNNNTNTSFKLSLEEDEYKKAYININDLYIKDNLVMNLNDLSLIKDNVNISMPNVDDSYYDISTIDELVAALLVTASNKSYEISGEIALKASFLEAITVSFNVKVLVEDDGSFILYAYLKYSGVGTILLDNSYTSYYYKDGYVIVDTFKDGLFKDKGKKIKVTNDEFLSNFAYYIFKFGMGMSNIIYSNIENSMNNETNQATPDASEVLVDYNFINNKYNLTLDMEELTNNSNLGNLSVSLLLNEVYYEDMKVNAITEISSASFNLLGILELTLNEPISLSNIETLEDGKLRFTSVDFSSIIAYLNNYNGEVGQTIEY